MAAAAVEPSGLEHWSPQVEQPSDLGPVAAQLRFGWLRRAYGEYAERCNEYASSVEGPVARFTTRPVRWVRALLPKPRPLAQLALCEGGTFKVRREGLSRVMIFEEEGCEVPDIDLLGPADRDAAHVAAAWERRYCVRFATLLKGYSLDCCVSVLRGCITRVQLSSFLFLPSRAGAHRERALRAQLAQVRRMMPCSSPLSGDSATFAARTRRRGQ